MALEIIFSILVLLICLWLKRKHARKAEDNGTRKINPGKISMVENIRNLSLKTKK